VAGGNGAHPLGLATWTTCPEFAIRATEFGGRAGFGLGGLFATCSAAQIGRCNAVLFHFGLDICNHRRQLVFAGLLGLRHQGLGLRHQF
jgi:hypothetical protein